MKPDIHVVDAFAADILKFKYDLVLRVIPLRIQVGHAASNHHGNHLVVIGVAYVLGRNVFSVSEHGQTIRYLENLIHAVGNIQNGNALRLKLCNDFKQNTNLLVCQGSRWLVHDDNLCAYGQTLCNLRHLRFRHRQVSHLGAAVKLKAQTVQLLLGILVQLFPVHCSVGCLRKPSQIHILRHRQVPHHVELLVYHGNTLALRILGGMEHHFLPIDIHVSGSISLGPRYNFHQGGLARAVLTAQGMYLAPPHIQMDSVQSFNSRKCLHNRIHLQY